MRNWAGAKMKSVNQIVSEIVESGEARSNDELENLFDFAANEAGYSDEKIDEAKKSPWFPWLKNPAAVSLGRLGGSAKSERKSKSSANNGRLGGRPKKVKDAR